MKRFSKKLDHRAPAIVQEILYKNAGMDKLRVTIEIQSKTPRLKTFLVKPTSLARVSTPMFCNADTCEFHQRELGPRTVLCMDHWRSWEAIT